MAHSWTVRILAALLAFGLGSTWGSEISTSDPTLEPPSQDTSSYSDRLSAEERSLVEFAMDRFRSQGLALPTVDFVFHESLMPCYGHMGLYHPRTDVLEMCTLDKHTILHELGHAWADENLSQAQRTRFVVERKLDSWNDHDHEWERRGTEHVAETIAWALLEQPPHVKWVEVGDDGSTATTYRILTLDIDVETLVDNFNQISGRELVFRHPGEWQAEPTPEMSPELERSRSRLEDGA